MAKRRIRSHTTDETTIVVVEKESHQSSNFFAFFLISFSLCGNEFVCAIETDVEYPKNAGKLMNFHSSLFSFKGA